MEIVVIDGQGGGIGKNIIQVLKEGEGFLLKRKTSRIYHHWCWNQ